MPMPAKLQRINNNGVPADTLNPLNTSSKSSYKNPICIERNRNVRFLVFEQQHQTLEEIHRLITNSL